MNSSLSAQWTVSYVSLNDRGYVGHAITTQAVMTSLGYHRETKSMHIKPDKTPTPILGRISYKLAIQPHILAIPLA